MFTEKHYPVRVFNRDDRRYFPGCENWGDREPMHNACRAPVIRNLENYVAVADKSGICVVLQEDDKPIEFAINMEIPNQIVAKHFLASLPNRLHMGHPFLCGWETL